MGMYDTIKPSSPIECPKCRGILREFQTKDLDRTLREFIEGCSFEYVDRYFSLPYPRYKQVIAYDYCQFCDDLVYQLFRFDETGILSRYNDPFLDSTS